jgi:hypothetical protein
MSFPSRLPDDPICSYVRSSERFDTEGEQWNYFYLAWWMCYVDESGDLPDNWVDCMPISLLLSDIAIAQWSQGRCESVVVAPPNENVLDLYFPTTRTQEITPGHRYVFPWLNQMIKVIDYQNYQATQIFDSLRVPQEITDDNNCIYIWFGDRPNKKIYSAFYNSDTDILIPGNYLSLPDLDWNNLQVGMGTVATRFESEFDGAYIPYRARLEYATPTGVNESDPVDEWLKSIDI